MTAITIRHIPSLDGIRAAAALLVFASHAWMGVPIPSSLGVTVFFFLSGYLITTLLRQEYEAGRRIDLRSFYIRRACRIFPPMYFMLAAMLMYALATEGAAGVDGGALLGQIMHLTNYLIIGRGSDASLEPYTSVMWSLAVEEHFYLLFPLFFILLARRMPIRRMAPVLAVLCMLALSWRLLLALDGSVANQHFYYSTDTRFDSLLFGCLMAMWRNPVLDAQPSAATQPSMVGKLVFAGALLLLLLTLVWRDPVFQVTLRYTLQGLALFPLFWLAVRYPSWIAFRWLNWKPMIWLGGISYSFYLAHPFWLHVAGQLADGWRAAALGLVMTILFSKLLYLHLEKPFLALGRRLSGSGMPAALKEAV